MDYKKNITYKDVLKYYYEKSKITGWRTPAILSMRIIILGAMIVEPWLITELIGLAGESSIQSQEVRRYVGFIAVASLTEFFGWRFLEYRIPTAQIETMKSISIEAFGYVHSRVVKFSVNRKENEYR